MAVKKGNVEIVTTLLSAGANPNIKNARFNSETPLTEAVRRVNLEIVRLLLSAGADPNTTNEDNHTPLLIVSCYDNRLDIIKELIHAGADPNLCSLAGITPLYTSSVRNQLDIVRELLLSYSSRIDINVKNWKGHTPLYGACERGHLEVVKELLRHGADPAGENGYHGTPLTVAIREGKTNVVNYLKNYTPTLSTSSRRSIRKHKVNTLSLPTVFR